MATLIGSLIIALGLDSGAFKSGLSASEKELKRSQKRIEQTGRAMANFGKTMSLAVTAPLLALGAASIKAAIESREAIGQVEAALASMGNAAGRSSEQLQASATALMRRSLYDDDEILRKVTANLLTFGNVAGTQFDRAQRAAVDLAARLHTDLQSAALMVGKALNDPAKGLAALRRVGIQFTAQQQDQIKAMAAAGNAAGAQSLMLAELERQFGGSAAAMRRANPMAALKQSFAEFQEQIGAKLLPLLPPLTNAITRVLNVFGRLSPEMQQGIIIAAGLAAAFGPLLVALGTLVSFGAPLLAASRAILGLAAAQTTAAGAATVAAAGFGSLAASLAPIAALAAAGYVVWKNWDDIAPRLQPLVEQLTAIGEGLGLIEVKAGATSAELERNKGFRSLGEQIRLANGDMGDFINALDTWSIQFGQWWSSSYENWAQAQAARSRAMWQNLATAATDAMRSMVTGVGTWVRDRLTGIWNGAVEKINMVKTAFRNLWDAVVGHSYIPDMVAGIAAEMARLDAVMVAPVTRATSAAQKAFRDMAGEVKGLLDNLFPEVAAGRQFHADEALLARSGLPGEALAEAKLRLLRRLGGLPLDGEFERQSFPGVPDSVAGLDEGLKNLAEQMGTLAERANVARVRVVKSFKDMADETMQAFSRLTSAIKGGGFLGILEGVIGLGLQLGSIGAFGKSLASRINASSLPGRANGGPVLAGHSYMVGERGREVFTPNVRGRIIPNSALQGAGPVRVEIYDTTGMFRTRIQGQIEANAPAIMHGGAMVAQRRQARRQTRLLE